MLSQIALISAGSNKKSPVGPPSITIVYGLRRLLPLARGEMRISSLFATPAFPSGTGPDFVNAAVAFETDLTADEILNALHLIEAAAGRSRDLRWGQRTLDLDLIGLGDQILPDAAVQRQWRDLPLDAQLHATPEQLILPHPRLQDRSFVLVPLAEVAPDWRHPLLDLSVVQMRDMLPAADRASVVPLDHQAVPR
ncbi:MAG: 2-amino-4-hydroxy-6-hydroxymethyldihydropteridine diphosphokinase [Loktanella sp.]|nr:2-amino-4-hydroxy-6-hydroxymethyldihydropteridine diphosphokinase [Loktanella sp.]